MAVGIVSTFTILYAILVVTGCTTNSLIIIATIRSKNLHGCGNILIAFCAFADILHVLGQLPKIIPAILGIIEIPSSTCSLLQIIPNFGINAGVILVLLIAIDRFIAVYFQKYYFAKDPRRYLSTNSQFIWHCIVIIAYAMLHYAFAYYYFENGFVICRTPEIYHGAAKKFWGTITLTVITMSLILYYAVWWKLKHNLTVCQDRRTFRSIFAVMSVIIVGWLLSMSIYNFVRHFLDLRMLKFVHYNISGIPVNSATSESNVVHLY